MPRIIVWGGPADGLPVLARGDDFIWIDRRTRRAYPHPHHEGGFRVLYRWEGGRYVYAGAAARVCLECNGLLLDEDRRRRRERAACPLCGGQTASAAG